MKASALSKHVGASAIGCHTLELGSKIVDLAHIWYVNIKRTGVDIVLDSGSRIRATPEEWDAAMRRIDSSGTVNGLNQPVITASRTRSRM